MSSSTTQSLSGRTLLMSGGSRGIGLAIAVAAAREGANVAFFAKTVDPDPRIPGTVASAAAAIREAGGEVLPIVGDIRDPGAVAGAVDQCVSRFGGIDIVVNNASAINLGGFGQIDAKRFQLILDVNVEGTFGLISTALPHLLESANPHVMTLSPPLNPDPKWLEEHAPYTVSKYAMTMLTLGLAGQFSGRIASYCLWPQTLIATAAVRNVVAGDEGMRVARRPEIMADAAVTLFQSQSAQISGRCHIDAQVLRDAGQTDMSTYAAAAGTADAELQLDLFVDSL